MSIVCRTKRPETHLLIDFLIDLKFKGSPDPSHFIIEWWISRSTQNRSKIMSFKFRVVLCRIRLSPTLFFKNKITWVWTTLKLFKKFSKTLIKTIYFSSKSSINCQITRIKSVLQIMLWIWEKIDYSQFYHLIITGWFYWVKWASNSLIISMCPISVSPNLIFFQG